tara:strand:- start:375 stop:626 length:252 start_codon:yes stop_codon:yes gene_type:complete
MNPLAVIKLVKSAKDVYDYVYKKNDADLQVEGTIKEIKVLKKEVNRLNNLVDDLQKEAHPPVFTKKQLAEIHARLKNLENNAK